MTLSPSPTLHNSGFEWCGLPYKYSLVDTSSIEVVKDNIFRHDFGGASVTIPLKEKVISLLDEVSEAVSAIGACNTITKLADGRLSGDNTDWLGIYACVHRLLPPRTSAQVGIVVGAGGTARAGIYALQKLGFANESILVYNPRTEAKAANLATEFKVNFLPSGKFSASEVGKVVGADKTIAVVLNTLPSKAGFTLAPCVLDAKPTVLDVNYLPKSTALLEQVKQAGDIKTARGIDMLIAQGLAQFELWTGRTSVAPVVNKAVRKFYSQVGTLPISRL